MQFTGLHDKNGKEIYEGDIMKTDSGSRQYRRLPHDDLASFCFRFSPEHASLSLDCAAAFEVIGNIYENPDLLSV